MIPRLLVILFSLAFVPAALAEDPVPERTERVIAIDWGIAETLVALGAPPLGLAESAGYREWVSEPAMPPSVSEIGLRSTPNLEYIQALEPDVILSTPQFAAIEPVLSTVAPVLSLATYTDELAPYRNAEEITRKLGTLLGRGAEAEGLIAETAGQIEKLAASLEGAEPKRVLVVNFRDDRNVAVFSAGSLYNDVLKRAGIENAWSGEGNAWGIVNATVDQFARFPEDIAVLIVEPVPLSIGRKLESGDPDGLLGQIPVFREGNYRILPPIWGFGALPSAGRFAEALAAHGDFLRAGNGS